MNNRHCVYIHTSPSGKAYVGQSVNPRRRWGYNGEHYKNKKEDGEYVQRLFARAILKYGWDAFEHKLLLENVSKSEADYTEKYLISWYKQHDMSYNITDGGEGVCCPRPPLSEEAKRKISERLLANHPMRGKHVSVETLAKITAANRNKVYTSEQMEKMRESGKRLSQIPITEERRKKYSEYRKNHPETWIGGWNKKEVHQYDINGKYIASYPSAIDAANALGINISSDISNCIKGNIASAGGFFWRSEKLEYIDISNYKIVKTKHGMRVFCLSEEDRLRRSAAHGKAVNQYSLDGKYIATYCTASEASRKTGIGCSGINKCCKYESEYKTSGGYKWLYDNVENRTNLNNVA